MQLHHTKGIVLRVTKYGETSVVASIYTQQFGLQSYLVKGVYSASKKSTNKASYFQPGAMLALTVYHHPQKQLQFINAYHWAYLYEQVLFDVVRNTVAMYLIEVLQHALKLPEANPELFELIENTLLQLDKGSNALVANLPLYFMVQLATELGFQLQGAFDTQTPILDLKEGKFVEALPNHRFYISHELAEYASVLNNIHSYNALAILQLNRSIRRQLLHTYNDYLAIHIAEFGTLKSFEILQSIIG